MIIAPHVGFSTYYYSIIVKAVTVEVDVFILA